MFGSSLSTLFASSLPMLASSSSPVRVVLSPSVPVVSRLVPVVLSPSVPIVSLSLLSVLTLVVCLLPLFPSPSIDYVPVAVDCLLPFFLDPIPLGYLIRESTQRENEPASKILELCILHLAMSEITVVGTRHQIVINEAVDLAKRFCDGAAPRIINGCLNTFIKGLTETESPVEPKQQVFVEAVKSLT
ncbi:hypothetical protein ACFE04_024828 [Oxalis oulophora]